MHVAAATRQERAGRALESLQADTQASLPADICRLTIGGTTDFSFSKGAIHIVVLLLVPLQSVIVAQDWEFTATDRTTQR